MHNIDVLRELLNERVKKELVGLTKEEQAEAVNKAVADYTKECEQIAAAPRFEQILISSDACNSCGRIKDKPHCPYCGRQKVYGYAATIDRINPSNGIMYRDVRTYRCQTCGRQFDDFQWFYECHAPLVIAAQRKLIKAFTADEHIARATSGVKYDENEKRHFRKVVGVSYDDIIASWQEAQKRKQKSELEKAAAKIKGGGAIKLPTDKLTPLQAHIENCNYCITHEDNCEIAKQLIIAENLPNQP